MPIPYIPRPIDIKNVETIEKMELDTSKLSRSQFKGLDTFIDLIKPANKRIDFRITIEEEIEKFAKYLLGLSAAEVRDSLRSVKIQINNYYKNEKNERDPSREYKFCVDGEVVEYLAKQKRAEARKKAKTLKSKGKK